MIKIDVSEMKYIINRYCMKNNVEGFDKYTDTDFLLNYYLNNAGIDKAEIVINQFCEPPHFLSIHTTGIHYYTKYKRVLLSTLVQIENRTNLLNELLR
jgi:hypothetical protein